MTDTPPPDTGPTTPADGAGSVDAHRITELEDQLRRIAADFDNLRKRFDREVGRERVAELERVAAAWLPVVDDLERALDHADADPASLRSGVRSIRDQAIATLRRLGYDRFEVVGEPFDPERHEAMGTIPSDEPAGTVAVTVRPGYGTDDDILRPAGVMVSTGPT